ncbi:GNAT family N-acetyltransferase [Actinokineospora terrae]|uniref:Acetyltransferase (GNAT) domain-containing protein n=1 Tax=Actinokineospora terrae TaxID=155974 RepID=A0A1H9S2A5_9PSEU|nr:GNAT family protein [Actinokineospora terrae]SER79131.1 Acetyltransferase (GNAT) domain-containing protein [Actinokineospora terrae]
MRRLLASGGGFGLAEPAEGEVERLRAESDGAFDVDQDPRPTSRPIDLDRAVVIDLATGELLGDVSWHLVSYGPTRACSAWNMGIGLLPSARGRGAGVAALRLLVGHLFATTDLDRLEASTDASNVPAQRALAGAGLLREGVARGAQLRGGERRDMVLYGVLRTDVA